MSESSDAKRESSITTSTPFTIYPKKQAPAPVDSVTVVEASASESTINVSFTKPKNETGIERYDIYIVKERSTTIDSGLGSPVGSVISGANNPSTAIIEITSTSTDSDGVVLGSGNYKIRVVSVVNDPAKYSNNRSDVLTFPITLASSGTDNGTGEQASAGNTP